MLWKLIVSCSHSFSFHFTKFHIHKSSYFSSIFCWTMLLHTSIEFFHSFQTRIRCYGLIKFDVTKPKSWLHWKFNYYFRWFVKICNQNLQITLFSKDSLILLHFKCSTNWNKAAWNFFHFFQFAFVFIIRCSNKQINNLSS